MFFVRLLVIPLVFLATPLVAQHQQSPADTGRMTWGHTDYARYTTADVCDRAVRNIWASSTRTLESRMSARDSTVLLANTDSIPSQVLTAARTCSDKFAVATLDPRELWSFLRLSLILGNDTQANAIVERQYALSTSIEDTATVLVTAIETFLSAVPTRLTLAHYLIARLDSLGASALAARFNARVLLLQYWHAHYHSDSLAATANAAIAFLRQMSPGERNTLVVYPPYEKLLLIANAARDVMAQQQVLDRALKEVGEWRNGAGAQWTAGWYGLLDIRKALYGKPTQALSATYTFNLGDTPHPAPGKLSLIVHIDLRCGARCIPLYRLIHDLKIQYGDALDLVLMTETHGYVPGSGPLQPADDAAATAQYLIDFLQLPAAIFVDESPVSKRPDGRLMRGATRIGEMFNGWRLVNTVLVDRSGIIRWLGQLGSMQDKQMIETVLNTYR